MKDMRALNIRVMIHKHVDDRPPEKEVYKLAKLFTLS